MTEITTAQVLALAEALRLPIPAEDLAEVTHRLNAFLDALGPLGDLPLAAVEPVPILPDPTS